MSKIKMYMVEVTEPPNGFEKEEGDALPAILFARQSETVYSTPAQIVFLTCFGPLLPEQCKVIGESLEDIFFAKKLCQPPAQG